MTTRTVSASAESRSIGARLAGVPRDRAVAVLLVAGVLAAPLVVAHAYVLHVMVLLGVYVILAESLNFITGFAGQLALGHAGFWAIGAYTAALLMLKGGWDFWPALGAAIGAGYLAGLVLGAMALRLRGDYLGMVTLGFGEIVRLTLNNLEYTHGPMGLPGIPAPALPGIAFDGEVPFLYLITVLAVLSHLALRRLIESRFGRALLAIREDEGAAEAMGIRTFRLKLWAFAISSAFAGLAGGFYASWISFVSPDTFTLTDSIIMSAMITLGGLGTIWGGLVGAVILGALPEVARAFGEFRLVAVGVLMVVMLVVRPEGLCGTPLGGQSLVGRLVTRWFGRAERAHA